ncbi:triphosphoribosyl-dephospho-CoA synthase [Enterococcus sp. PF1-24]|uniref:triphosphoribosyl-dephospho-CoA synthase CitG n=1 Tax=unclassified Enterococcus TaxID=2608891 RepID=UPI002472F942|nr:MULTISPECIES: triphosphoribosyl-dephospho-CoA synthase CitG [unclassified Enterococcus]MDH6365577.1 triphosphoribosyl-dephospho-CoA synthase [Enterococcus sp. PFB1-1]MDH6402679.1 triphosphoribosyl-dephospho-CoA synthase [Enterococcus sp. PF1-24]
MTNWSVTEIAGFAESALLYEVALTPKPGLVDRSNNGAHQDMNFFTFMDSIVALAPFFQQYLQAGLTHRGSLPALFEELRILGVPAEKAMLKATAGVNTHKGANFSLAVLLGATGFYLQEDTLPFTAEDTGAVLKIASQMTAELVEKDFANLLNKKQLTYGEKLYLEQGLTGIRGEAAAGYPVLTQLMLPYLRVLNQESADLEENLLRCLILLMSEVEDGNLLHRGGFEAWQQVKTESKKIHQAQLTKEQLLDELAAYDQILIKRHLSPGGAADLLALGIYFAKLEGLF